MASLFATTFAYHLRHFAGDRWDEVIKHELEHMADSTVPGIRTIGLLPASPDAKVIVSIHASTIIARSRSQAAGAFLRTDADVWLTVDEDVFALPDTTERMILAARATRGIVSAPCWLRLTHEDRANFTFPGERAPILRDELGFALAGVSQSGFGLVAIHRSAIERMAESALWVELDAQGRYPALFLESVERGMWLGEDFAFCERATRSDVPVHILLDVYTEHAGRVCSVRANAAGELLAHLVTASGDALPPPKGT